MCVFIVNQIYNQREQSIKETQSFRETNRPKQKACLLQYTSQMDKKLSFKKFKKGRKSIFIGFIHFVTVAYFQCFVGF